MKRYLVAMLLLAVAGTFPGAILGQSPAIPTAVPEEVLARGEAASRKCQACHDFAEGGPSRLGPPMFGIVGKPAASVPGYSYSRTLIDMRDAGLVWSPETLAPFLADPRAFAPGSKMAFAGIRNEEELEAIIAYLVGISPGYVPSGPPEERSGPTPSPSDRTR